MNKATLLLAAACMGMAAPVLAQQPQMPTVEVRRQLPVGTACPNIFSALPQMLEKTAAEIDAAAEVIVDFALAGEQLSDLRTQSSHPAFDVPVRRAVRRLHCRTPDQARYTVHFRIVFDDRRAGGNAQLPPDFAPAMLRR